MASGRFSSFIHVPVKLPDTSTAAAMYANYSAQSYNACPSGTQETSRNKPAGTPFCSGDCAVGCNDFLTATDEGYPNLCGHYSQSTHSAACCYTGCGQVENMANCAIVYKDNCNQNLHGCNVGGVLMCKRACSSRCDSKLSTVRSYQNYLRFPTVFQMTDAASNDCKPGSSRTKVPWQTCIYDVASFGALTTPEIKDAQSKFGASDPNLDEVMTYWCAQPVTTGIPVDPLTKKASAQCSRVMSTTEDGKTCRDWLSSLPPYKVQGYKDAIASTYCSKYNTSECACVNRGLSPEYMSLKSAFPYNDGCWFNPCLSSYAGSYFQPSDVQAGFRTAENGNGSMCPLDVCVTYLQAKGSNVTLTDNEFYTSC